MPLRSSASNVPSPISKAIPYAQKLSTALLASPPLRQIPPASSPSIALTGPLKTLSNWVRDVTFDEDRSQVRKLSGPQVMASLRNLTISLLRMAGAENIAQALRSCAWNKNLPLRLLGIASL